MINILSPVAVSTPFRFAASITPSITDYKKLTVLCNKVTELEAFKNTQSLTEKLTKAEAIKITITGAN